MNNEVLECNIYILTIAVEKEVRKIFFLYTNELKKRFEKLCFNCILLTKKSWYVSYHVI